MRPIRVRLYRDCLLDRPLRTHYEGANRPHRCSQARFFPQSNKPIALHFCQCPGRIAYLIKAPVKMCHHSGGPFIPVTSHYHQKVLGTRLGKSSPQSPKPFTRSDRTCFVVEGRQDNQLGSFQLQRSHPIGCQDSVVARLRSFVLLRQWCASPEKIKIWRRKEGRGA